MTDPIPTSPLSTPGFALWLRAPSREIDLLAAAEALGIDLVRRGAKVELIDAAALAHALYTRKQPGSAVALAVSMTVDALVRHGIACVVVGGVGGSREMSWGRRKPERLLELVYLNEGEVPSGKGPFVVVRPGGEDSPPPDPPTSAKVGETATDDPSRPTTESNPDEDDEQIRWDTRPVLEALGKAGWIAPESSGGNGDDDLIRKRLRDLGYL